MTVPQRNEEAREARFPSVSPLTKGHWPAAMENDSPSWDRNSRVTSSSWPGEAEVAATRKIIQLWYAIERNIYGESEPEVISEPSMEECIQWRSQLIHLRVIGKGSRSFANRETDRATNADGSNEGSARRSGTNEDRDITETLVEDSVYRSEGSVENAGQRRLVENQREVFDQLLEHVCNELAKRRRDENKDSLGQDLDEVLRITPAPTYSGRKWTNGRKKRENGESRRTSANGNRSAMDRSSNELDPVLREAVADRTENGDSAPRVEETTEKLRVARNKLGTVFNEKIVVSPVPFVLSTRESFTTLRTTPISFRTQNFKISSSEGLCRYMNSASTMISGHRIAPSRVSQIHSAWQAPVCPTVWPKNIKLAPIDPARLPSSKNRTPMVDRDTPVWTKRLSCQPNFLDIGSTYIPIALGNIEAYTRLDDYAEDCIKEIEAIGVLEPIGPSTALLHSTTIENPRSTIKLAIGHLRTEYVYPIGVNGVCRGLRNAWDAVRVYGTLVKRNDEIVLLVDYIVRVEDFEACEETLVAVAKFARTKYSMYVYDPMTSGQLRSYVEKVTNEEKQILDRRRSS